MSAPYHERRNPHLPWGYWLHAEPGQSELVDEDGNRWESVRAYLWHGRLGMPLRSTRLLEGQMEFMLAILAAKERVIVRVEEKVLDLCEGSWTLCEHYENWLEAQGLLNEGRVGGLTPEGRAVLVLLASTRSAEHAQHPIGLAALGLTRGLDRGATRGLREQELTRIEVATRHLPLRFVRHALDTRPAIKLVGLAIGDNVPLTRTLWMLTFPDTHARDRMFAWIATRVERWDGWGRLVQDSGAKALSEHFLQLALADRPAGLGE